MKAIENGKLIKFTMESSELPNEYDTQDIFDLIESQYDNILEGRTEDDIILVIDGNTYHFITDNGDICLEYLHDGE